MKMVSHPNRNRKLVAAREHIATLAEADGEFTFAREVRAGCWDHRPDVKVTLERLLPAKPLTP